MATSTFIFTDVNPSKHQRIGTRKKDVYGNEYVYAQGVGSLAIGSWVIFKDELYVPVLLVNTPLTGRVAISMTANTSTTSYSWYLVSGNSKQVAALTGVVKLLTDASGDQKAIYQSGTAGSATTATAAATKVIYGAIAEGNPASNLGDCIIQNPFCIGTSTV